MQACNCSIIPTGSKSFVHYEHEVGSDIKENFPDICNDNKAAAEVDRKVFRLAGFLFKSYMASVTFDVEAYDTSIHSVHTISMRHVLIV